MLNQEVISYVNKAKNNGMGKQQIEGELLKAGWLQTDINEAFNGAIFSDSIDSDSQITKKKNISKIIFIVAAGFLLAGIVFGGLWFADKKFNWKIFGSTNISQNLSANWPTYINNDYGYQIKYPAEWVSRSFCPNPARCIGFFPPNKEKGSLQLEKYKMFFAYNGDVSMNFIQKTTIDQEKKLIGNSLEGTQEKEIKIGSVKFLVIYNISGKYNSPAKFVKSGEVFNEVLPSDFTENFSGIDQAFIPLKDGVLSISSYNRDIFEKMISTLIFN